MRILFTSFPAIGHFHPVAPLASAARDAGHDVRVASGRDLADWATRCGFDAYVVGPAQAELVSIAQKRFPDAWPEHLFTDVWVALALPGLVTLGRSWRPDLVVHEEEEYAGVLLASLLDIPVITHSWHAPVRSPAGRLEAQQLLANIWTEHQPGAPVRSADNLYLDACPPAMQSEDIHLIENVVGVRPVSFDGVTDAVPAWLHDLPRPAAYVTLGTVGVFSTAERLRLIVDAVAPLVASVVITTGPNAVESLGALPAHAHAIRYLPQSAVLPNVDLVVSQAGAGGTLGALEHALPHLMLPFGSQSQLAAAAAIDRLGAGRSMAPDQRDERSIRAAAAELLHNPDFRTRAAAIRSDLQRLPSPADVVKLLVATAA